MSGILDFDLDEAEQTRRAYGTADIVGQRRWTRELLCLQAGETVLDVGSGPGLLAAEMAEEVGPSGAVHGVDFSKDMLAMARDHCRGRPTVSFQRVDATELPFLDGSIDAAVSTQVYEYVTDVEAALAELYRVLRPGGRALVLDTDASSVLFRTEHPERMARVMKAWNEHLVDPYLPRRLNGLLTATGFALTRWEVFPIFNLAYDHGEFGYWMIDSIREYVPGRNGVTEEEAEAWAAEQRALAQKGTYFFSLNRYLFLAAKAA